MVNVLHELQRRALIRMFAHDRESAMIGAAHGDVPPAAVTRRGTAIGIRRSTRQAARALLIAARRPTAAGRVLPDALIVGAQRSGTTSLFRHLLEHPAFVPPLLRVKGVHYFDTGYTHGFDWYRAHFPLEATMRARRQTYGHAATCEASPYYLFHPAAPARIAKDLPNVLLVVMLRDPVDRAWSHYQHMRWEGHEDLETFELALARETSRLAGEEERLRRDPAYRSYSHQHHAYAARGLYAQQLRRLFEHVEASRVLVVASDALFADPASQLPPLLDFIGLDPQAAPAPLAVHNSTHVERIPSTAARQLRRYYAEPNRELHDLLQRRIFPWP